MAKILYRQTLTPDVPGAVSSSQAVKGVPLTLSEGDYNYKALDDDIIQIKNAVIDEIYSPAEGKIKITEIDTLKVSFEENRKNKISIDDLLVANSLQYQKAWKSKELMEDYFATLGIVIAAEEAQEEAQDDNIVQEDEIQEEAPKKTRKRSKALQAYK